jgi:oligosaccharide repeat unit polymerase
MFGKWFNHVSLYTWIWGGALILFELRLINYYPLETETWIVIVFCWLLFILGSSSVVLVRFAVNDNHPSNNPKADYSNIHNGLKQLKNILWFLNIVTFTSALHDLYIVSKIFGGLSKALILGNLLYSYRVSEGLPGSIPYISSLVFTAAMLAGNYTARIEKVTLVAVLPLIIIIMIDLANMGRADILVAAILFTSTYLLTPKQKDMSIKSNRSKVRKLALLFVVSIIVFGGSEFIRSTRHVKEGISGSSKTLQKLNSASFITPSIYLYLSSDYGVLNQYIKHGGENTPFGGNTFLPVYRILEKLGVDVHANVYQPWYKTPVKTNTGTYLRELHGDFGVIGLFAIPYIIGLLTSVFWFRVKDYGRISDLSVVAFFYGIIGMSFFVMVTRLGSYFFFIFVSILIGRYLDKKFERKILT